MGKIGANATIWVATGDQIRNAAAITGGPVVKTMVAIGCQKKNAPPLLCLLATVASLRVADGGMIRARRSALVCVLDNGIIDRCRRSIASSYIVINTLVKKYITLVSTPPSPG